MSESPLNWAGSIFQYAAGTMCKSALNTHCKSIAVNSLFKEKEYDMCTVKKDAKKCEVGLETIALEVVKLPCANK